MPQPDPAPIDVDALLAELDGIHKALPGTMALAEFKELPEVLDDAARALRTLRADFERYADHEVNCPQGPWSGGLVSHRTCTCGLDAARARWAGSKEKKT